ncbi:MAG: hypothetical protein QG629_547 [Patescibacteria group bacterium]|nr:hypothetical protein [Candidatus Saccharibacteria bacterium]MDQ5963465.1 hypothetical protein [Patescibacteria group bacterium]
MSQTNPELDCGNCALRTPGRQLLCTDVVYKIMKVLPSAGVDTSCDTRSSHEIATQFVTHPDVLEVAKMACATALLRSSEAELDDARKQVPFHGAYF